MQPQCAQNDSNVVSVVNILLRELNLDLEVTVSEDITPHVFLEIYEGLTGESLNGARKPAVLREDKEMNCQLILNKLSDIIGCPLDHISSRSLVTGDPMAVANLVEIFSGLMEQLMDAIVSESESKSPPQQLLGNNQMPDYDRVPSNISDRTVSIDEMQSRYPNIFSVAGRDKIAEVFDSNSSLVDAAANNDLHYIDEDLESLLNVEANSKPRKSPPRGSPLRNKAPSSNKKPTVPTESFRGRKIAKVADNSSSGARKSDLRNLRFAKSPAKENSMTNSKVLDGSSFKTTFAEIKSELANEKAELAKRLDSVRTRYRRAEIAAKLEAQDAQDSLRNRKDILDTSGASSSLLNVDHEHGYVSHFLIPPNRKKQIKPTFVNSGFLSKTHAEERKRNLAKRLCEKYKASRSSPVASPSAPSRRDLIARLQTNFPSLELDDATSRRLWAEYSRHVQALGRVADGAKLITRRHAREAALDQAERQQQILLRIVRREMAQAKRLREENEQRKEVLVARNRTEDAKIQRLRSERYYSEFVEQARARMASKQFGEETLFRNVFKEAVKAQRNRLLDLASASRELAAHRNEAEAKRAAQLRTSFQDRLRMLNEKVINERALVEAREKEQTQYLSKIKRELRTRLESELRGVQAQMAHNYTAERMAFRELDADAIKMQIAAEAKQTQPFLK